MSEEYEIEVIPVVVAAEPIELYKILKIENLVTSGSEAKTFIAEGYVYVNGEIETRKRKKIMYGDIIGFNGEAFQVTSEAQMQEYIDNGEYEVVDEPDYADEPEYLAEPEYIEECVEEFIEPEVTEVAKLPKSKKNKNSKKKNKQATPDKADSGKKKGAQHPLIFNIIDIEE